MLRQRRALHEGEHQKHDLEHGFWQRRAPKARSRARFLARGRAPKSTIFGTRESTKKHDFVHEGGHQKARSRARFFCTRESTELRKTLKTTFAQNIKKSFFWLLQLLGRTQIMLTKTVQWYIYLCIDFISLLVLWIFARLQKTALLQKKCSRGSFLPHCQLDLLQFLNLLFADICVLFAQIFGELVSHQSKQFLFSVELG